MRSFNAHVQSVRSELTHHHSDEGTRERVSGIVCPRPHGRTRVGARTIGPDSRFTFPIPPPPQTHPEAERGREGGSEHKELSVFVVAGGLEKKKEQQ